MEGYPEKKRTCGNCQHRTRPHYYRRDWLYCSKIKSGRTAFGLKRVKSRQEACPHYSEDQEL